VKYVVFCYNATPHSSTGFAPIFLMTGQVPRWNIDYLLNCVDESSKTVPEYTALVLSRLNTAFELTRNSLQHTAETMSSWYNRHECKTAQLCTRRFIACLLPTQNSRSHSQVAVVL